MTSIIPQKQCTKCKTIYASTPEFFPRSKNAKGGLHEWCKSCKNEYSRQYHAKHRTEIRERQTVYYYETREDRLEHRRSYYRDHKYEENARSKRYYDNNLEYMFIKGKIYRDEHKERILMNNRIRIHRRRAGGTNYTRKDIEKLYIKQDGKCQWCGCEITTKSFHIDHVYPLSRGGSNCIQNIALACPTCNLSKGDKIAADWLGGII